MQDDVIFDEKVRMDDAKKHPIRNAVAEHWPAISDSRAAGRSLAAIYRVLKKEGHNVGAGTSSFRGAVKYLDEHPPGKSEPMGVPQSDPYADNRHTSDF